ncbi:uncharacterized protein LOC111457164 isoform X2 [Cucurbita moschata]|uniref:Uncharacterized protein LOC111457164 isoform X2 n=1 Tax=Cucurbita moschata TaxID=3662 RepID=A0A6J1GTD8_CUCMO|nr:uncharacterized protein LOC111457164 isoform X2 [Cucurbita moschata]
MPSLMKIEVYSYLDASSIKGVHWRAVQTAIFINGCFHFRRIEIEHVQVVLFLISKSVWDACAHLNYSLGQTPYPIIFGCQVAMNR